MYLKFINVIGVSTCIYLRINSETKPQIVVIWVMLLYNFVGNHVRDSMKQSPREANSH